MKQSKHPIYQGALLLTATGLLCRFVGFYYKIFLSRAIGAKELGLYQLSLPLLAIGVSFANSGIHTAISKYVASETANKGKNHSLGYLYTGLLLSLLLGLAFAIPAFYFAPQIASYFFHETSITGLLRILCFCIPLECLHGCINGYYYGLQKTAIPSIGQCMEQFFRVGSVIGMYYILKQTGLPFLKWHAMLGLFIGEAVATLYYLTVISLQRSKENHAIKYNHTYAKRIISLAYPVTGTRLSLTLLNSAESILIPVKLCSFGLTSTQALSIYGIYSGMALPMIFFPTVLSNSVAVMLLPSISKAKAEKNDAYIEHTILVSFFLCMILGFAFAFSFFFSGMYIGERVFQNQVAGVYIKTLGWLCPFLFLGTTMNSILNGLGNTKETFLINITGASIRILFILWGVKRYGFRAFLLGVLISQILAAFIAYFRVCKLCLGKSKLEHAKNL